MTRVSHAIDRIEVSFDDPNLAANAGPLLFDQNPESTRTDNPFNSADGPRVVLGRQREISGDHGTNPAVTH